MRKIVIVLVVIMIASQAFPQQNDTMNETYRAQVHFSPIINRMGAPISVVKTDTLYHMFYQYNPFNLQDGFYSWGSAASTDLLHWKHEGIVLTQPESVSDSMLSTPWWGTAFTEDGSIQAIFNRWGDGLYNAKIELDKPEPAEKQISPDASFLRCEPFVFWHKESSKWVMLAFDPTKDLITFYNSDDKTNWTKTGELKYKYGFAQLFQLSVDRMLDDTRWVLISNNGWYEIGDFDGKTFTPEGIMKNFDGGKNVGGSICYYDNEKSRLIMFSELKSKEMADMPSNGQLSFPTELSLHKNKLGIELYRKPINEISTLCKKPEVITNKKVYPGLRNNVLSGIKGDCFYIKALIDLKNCDQMDLILRSDKNQIGEDINFNVPRNVLTIMDTQVGYKPENGKLNLEIIVDRSSIEVFLEGGHYVVSNTFAPEPKSRSYELISKGGEILVEKMEIYPLKSIWQPVVPAIR